MVDRQAHVVSEADVEAKERLLAATPGLVGEPSDAERSRTTVALATHATLATVAVDRAAGYPFGSLAACAADEAGRVVLCLSDLAVHSVNLAADPRASVLVTAPADGDPLAAARVTLVGDLREVPADERTAAREHYRQVHSQAFYAGFADFRVYRLEPAAVRYVGGFGRMSWVSPASYAVAAPDPLRTHVDRIVRHMNDDHADALVAFCRVLAGRADVTAARIIGVDRYGFDVLTTAPGPPRALRFGFGATADTADAVRAAMVDLVRRTR
jgi:heme oxygenase (biliverdin-IX-beta and delta-forming)